MSFELKTQRRASRGPASEAERAMRVDLAAAYRLVTLERWDDLIYSHISAAVPDEPGHFLINPFGLAFDEVTASNLVKINESAEVIGDSPHSVNVTGFALHAALHAARPDAVCVLHLHETSAIAVSAQADGLLPLSQHALRFEGELAYHDYEGLAFSPHEGQSLVRALGSDGESIHWHHPTVAAALATIAQDAVALFGDPTQRARLRRCENSTCRVIFYDDSRPGSRRWCAPNRCGDRIRARAYRQRARAH